MGRLWGGRGEKPFLLGQQFYLRSNRISPYVTGGGVYTLNKVARREEDLVEKLKELKA